MSQLNKVGLYARADELFPINPTTKVRSRDANAMVKDLIDSVVNTITDASKLSGDIGTFAEFEAVMEFNLSDIV